MRRITPHILGFIAFIFVWILGCMLVDTFMAESKNSWVMLAGYVVGLFSALAETLVMEAQKNNQP